MPGPRRSILLGWLLAVALFVIAGLCLRGGIFPPPSMTRARLGFWCGVLGVLWTLRMAWVAGIRGLGMAWSVRATVLMLVPLQGCNIAVVWGSIWLRQHGFMEGLQGVPIALLAVPSIFILMAGSLLAVGIGADILKKRITPRWPAILLITLAVFGVFSVVALFAPGAPEQESEEEVAHTVVAPPDTLSIIRAELEKQYDENRRAFLAKDFDAIMALRTPEFHTVTTEHLVHERAEMERATRELLDSTERWGELGIRIDSLGLASVGGWVDVGVLVERTALGSDGRAHSLLVRSRRRESWRKTTDGWRLWRIEAIGDLTTVDHRQLPDLHPLPIP